MTLGSRLLLTAREDLGEGTTGKRSSRAHCAARPHSVAIIGKTGSLFLNTLIFQISDGKNLDSDIESPGTSGLTTNLIS